ncbi:MAG: 50S ribosomal protein L15 [Microbacteriaceae bacterium]|jgi:large subunit ribosomal protein L15|nr:50S ribosomal protein L15 [Microbacteriaceae bacterium]MBT7803015.1 50S ribosomal protein L15 [Microbacteriaceae bacterium]
MAEEKKPAAKKPAAKKDAAAKPAAAKKPAAKPAAAKAGAAKATPAKAPAAKTAAAKAPAAKKPAAKAPAAKAAAPKAPAKAAAKPAAKAPAKPAAKAPAKPAADKSEAPVAKTAAKPATKKAAPKADAPARASVVKLHHLRPAPGAKKAKTRVGRGEGSKGKTAGRGTKGTKARYQVRPGFEGGQLTSVMRAPKLRGFKNPFRVEYQVVNVGRLGELYPKGGEVTVSDLVAKGAVRKNQKVKVLAEGDLSVALTVTVDKVSAQAMDKIVKAGGAIKE